MLNETNVINTMPVSRAAAVVYAYALGKVYVVALENLSSSPNLYDP